MTSRPLPTDPEVLPDLIDLDAALKNVTPLESPHDWAAPQLFPDDAEFDEFLGWLRSERLKDLA